MTKSTIDDQSGDGGFDIGSSVADLFGDIADESLEDEPVDRGTDDDVGGGFGGVDADEDDGIEDQTAANVFGELKADVDAEDDGADEVLGSETPADIIASADEPIREPESPIDDLLASKKELEDLLLTGRTKDQEFLWIETESDGETDSDADADPDAATNPDSEINPDAKPSSGPDADETADDEASDARESSASDPEIVSDAADTAGVEDDPRDIEEIIADREAQLDGSDTADAAAEPSSGATTSSETPTKSSSGATTSSKTPTKSSSGTSARSTADTSSATDDETPTGVRGLFRSLLGILR